MAITVDWLTKTFFVPQADLTLISGTLYELDVEDGFRSEVNELMASWEGIVFDTPIEHNTTYTISGVEYARAIQLINGYNVTFTPDSQWSVRLTGANNNLGDVEAGILNQNQVQVIPQNSGGLVVVGSGLSVTEQAMLRDLWRLAGLEVGNPMTVTPTKRTTQGGEIDLDITGDGITTSTVERN